MQTHSQISVPKSIPKTTEKKPLVAGTHNSMHRPFPVTIIASRRKLVAKEIVPILEPPRQLEQKVNQLMLDCV